MFRYFAALVLSIVLVSACSGADEELCKDGVCSPAAKPPAALGGACEMNFDCAMHLACRVDRVRHIADGQCTISCTKDEDCDAFGPFAMCLGAEICVARCATERDCPAWTRCGGAGWCERTGPGSGRPSCSGTPIPCAMLEGTECSNADGCHDSSTCSGIAADCPSLADLRSCIGQLGCTWSDSTKSCSGTAEPCSAMTFDSLCGAQRGCTWTSICSGTPSTECSTKSLALCDSTPGCVLEGP